MKETMNVTHSEEGHIPVGTTLTVHRRHTNQYTDRTTIKVSADTSIPNRPDGTKFQLKEMEDGLKEIGLVGLKRDGDIITVS